MIKSKTIEKFQDKLDPITDGYISMLDSLFKKSFINFLFLLMLTPIIYMFVVAVFPKVGLIINSIILIYYSYHYILKLTSKTELDLYIYKLVIIIFKNV